MMGNRRRVLSLTEVLAEFRAPSKPRVLRVNAASLRAGRLTPPTSCGPSRETGDEVAMAAGWLMSSTFGGGGAVCSYVFLLKSHCYCSSFCVYYSLILPYEFPASLLPSTLLLWDE